MFMTNSFPGGSVPQINFGMVDVREVAQAHVQCLERDEAQGKRYMLIGDSIWFRDIGAILHEKYGPQGYTIPTTEAKYCMVKFVSFFNS